MSEYRIDPAQLQTSAGRVADHEKEIMARIQSVMTEVRNTEAFWTGGAKNRYADLMDRWNRQADSVRKMLEDTVTALRQAASDYSTTEQTNVSRFNG